MSSNDRQGKLTGSLEDYLETIYDLIRQKKHARIRDIARARQVRAGSVTSAMQRLARMGLIKYARNEYIELTPSGEEIARRIEARHNLLTWLLRDVFQMSPDAARRDACAMEHSLSNEGMDRLVRFFEFMQVCPMSHDLLDRFHKCSVVHGGAGECDLECDLKDRKCPRLEGRVLSIADLAPGEQGRVTQVNGRGAIRQRLLDMGILPKTLIEVERVAPAGDPIWIKLEGFQLSLRRKEAEAVMVMMSSKDEGSAGE